MDSDVQLDLFGEVEAAEVAAAEWERERDEWRATFERPDWVAPWDTGDGAKKGDARPGWRCPDPACRQIEPSAYLLSINHGFNPDDPRGKPYDGRCWRVRRHARRQGEAGSA